MALVVVDTNMISLLVKLKHGRLKKDEAHAKRYEAYLKGQDMIRAFPTEAELHVWLHRLPEDQRKTEYTQGIQEVPERVNDFETDFGLSSGAAPTAAESRRGHGKRLRVSHTPLENPAGFPHLTAAGGNHHAIFSFSNDSGRLIQAGPGSAGGFGRPFGNRSGCSWNARSSTPWRAS